MRDLNCILCENPLPMVGGVSIHNGKICKTCATRIPSIMLENAKNWSSYTLEVAIDYEDELYDKFDETASYGDLHIDTTHGLFALSKKMKDGRPIERNVFSIYDLSEVCLCCGSPVVNSHNQVHVDIEFRARIEKLSLPIRTTVKKGVLCQSKKIDSEHLSWEEPADMLMFIQMFNTMLKGTWEKMQMYLCGRELYEYEIEKARAIFMLPERFTMEDLKKARNMLVKAYHPDMAGEDDVYASEATKIINNSYKLLQQYLENQKTGDATE